MAGKRRATKPARSKANPAAPLERTAEVLVPSSSEITPAAVTDLHATGVHAVVQAEVHARAAAELPVAGPPVADHPAELRPVEAAPADLPTAHLVAPEIAEPRRASRPRGKRVASRHSSARGPLFRGLPSPPVLIGVAALAISAGGALTAAGTGLSGQDARFSQASALSGASDVSRVSLLDRSTISRDSRRDALADATDARLVDQAESQLKQRDAALAKFAQQAEQQAAKLRLNQWQLPVTPGVYHLTARFGEVSGLWSSVHTGLDFAAPSGTPIHAVANGVVTSVGYDGAYGNKTVITLDDGTELWYCHQTSYEVTVGQEVHAGDEIGTVGSTGNTTGPHLHLEVRPGAGDPVDPYQALVVHGLQP
ncbi:peptidoglycan DD-metalloendopeptidase family protein [Nocardioides sp.]|uniref:M23 family metallopeptidase n=1 Tax=Nocardioides sp. TaxID=35761 RepID=UPI003783FA7B